MLNCALAAGRVVLPEVPEAAGWPPRTKGTPERCTPIAEGGPG